MPSITGHFLPLTQYLVSYTFTILIISDEKHRGYYLYCNKGKHMSLAKKVLLLLLFNISIFSRNYFIFSVEHDLPMGVENENLRKNYYVNVGEKQGIQKGTILNVYRQITENDPFESKTRYQYQIKIGELEVIHQDADASIAVRKELHSGAENPIFEIRQFMVGDEIQIKINN